MATKQYVSVDFDEFENKSEFSHLTALKLTAGGRGWKLRRVQTADLDLLLLDYNGGSIGGCIERVIISYDGETKEVSFDRHNLDVKATPNGVFYYETGVFVLGRSDTDNRKILEDIGSANLLKMRIYYEKNYDELNERNAENLLNHFREFYSDVYESDKFAEQIKAYQAKPKPSGCFIATAAMGTEYHPDVLVLRQFRDEWLLRGRFDSLGKEFVRLYYRYSPPIADYISTRKFLRRLARWVVVLPLRMIASQLLK